MSYSRWSDSHWYTYWQVHYGKYAETRDNASFMIDFVESVGIQQISFTAKQLRENMEACMKEVAERSTGNIEELREYVERFLADVEDSYSREITSAVNKKTWQCPRCGLVHEHNYAEMLDLNIPVECSHCGAKLLLVSRPQDANRDLPLAIEIDELTWKCPLCKTVHKEGFPTEPSLKHMATVECTNCGVELRFGKVK